ncbi:metal ABC transporter ATP-binding protein [Maledivibacter halophilus]|uniref:Zinc transport system ATP-binding protein n=1 Tax=Maledivibacter halophilus TaxID=36842 RepID=A0A1T5LYZ8_9FIRM|nr:metal ABC transporter ATP-binding protein [Maledivibacter halophilus]SKC81182.1 zinc transport system ATP-binding protein [Maledivibacter halophilus]
MYDINIENLSVYYGPVCALQNINLKVKSNEILGIMGPNGGGKTTLLKTILKIIKPTEGKVSIKGDSSIGYVPQFTVFNRSFPINVLDVVLMGKLSRKIKWFQKYSFKDKKDAEELINKLGLLELKNRQIGQLSGGQLQKVLIARALITDPKILILDEPTANLDTKAKKEIHEMLKKLSENKTILIVTHEMKDIFPYIDTAAYVNKTLHYYENPQKLKSEIFEKTYGYSIGTINKEKVIDKKITGHKEDEDDQRII